MKKQTERDRLIELVWLQTIRHELYLVSGSAMSQAISLSYDEVGRIADHFIAARKASARVKRSRTKSRGGQ